MQHLFPVKIVETLTKAVYVPANNKTQAYENAQERWSNGEYVLDDGCFQNVDFFVSKPETYRYYCIMRPVAPGTVPKGFADFGDLDRSTVIPSINRGAWGWVEYERPLNDSEIRDYELVYAGDDVKEEE